MITWHKIPEYENSYRIGKTPLGKIKVERLPRTYKAKDGRIYRYEKKELKRGKNKPSHVTLIKNGKNKIISVKKLWELSQEGQK